LLRPADAQRDKELLEVTTRKEGLERELAALLPKGRDPAKVHPGELAGALADDSVFIDLYRYWSTEKTDRRYHYVAFVLARTGAVRRVELGPAAAIEEALTAWRRFDRDAERQAGLLRRLIWEPLEKQFPGPAKTVYISADGDLARLPFAALPDRQPGSVLLERYAFASVVSGPFLLEQLGGQQPVARTDGALVAIGGVRYDPPN